MRRQGAHPVARAGGRDDPDGREREVHDRQGPQQELRAKPEAELASARAAGHSKRNVPGAETCERTKPVSPLETSSLSKQKATRSSPCASSSVSTSIGRNAP